MRGAMHKPLQPRGLSASAVGKIMAEVLAGLTSGILVLVSVAVSMLLIHAGWRAGAAIGLAAVGAALLALTLVPASASVRRGRMGDVVETVTLLALLPLMVLGSGLVSAVAG